MNRWIETEVTFKATVSQLIHKFVSENDDDSDFEFFLRYIYLKHLTIAINIQELKKTCNIVMKGFGDAYSPIRKRCFYQNHPIFLSLQLNLPDIASSFFYLLLK